MSAARMLVVAKAPVAGRVKTRLGAAIGMAAAAEVAASALLDSLLACTAAAGAGRCHLSLDGDLAGAVRGDEIAEAVRGWTVHVQRGDVFAERLVNAHHDVGAGPVVQIGMDTPQVTAGMLLEAASGTDGHDAVLGPAEDGGWWVLALRDPRAAGALAGVPMSTPTTYDDTRAALLAAGTRVGTTAMLRDVDTVADAHHVAATVPHSHFSRAWAAVGAR
ncbi:hypothetical protein FB382_001272 [Nocardioides ginsengisegetis]|uniref:Uncharacterized protein n=1 Tax=Nocardioides ginsengisegetis TaxID=661491 RepID=A0A7W3IYK2_9ACTN|nr:hypothetical protein [Nocardioides ginsengisegetis]